MQTDSAGLAEPRLGFLFDGWDDGLSPPVGSFRVADESVILLDVPSLGKASWPVGESARESCAKTHLWAGADPSDVPKTLVLRSAKGAVTLFGVHRRGVSCHGGVTLVHLGAEAAVFAEPDATIGELSEVEGFSSSIEGLGEFCSFRIFRFSESGWGSDEPRTPIEVLPEERVSWESAGFGFELVGGFRSEVQEPKQYRLSASTELRTFAAGRASVFDHYAAQRKVRALLVLTFGARMPWQGHSLKDAQFGQRFFSGRMVSEWVPVALQNSLAEHQEPPLTFAALAYPVLHLGDLEAEGMTKWCDMYEDDDFRRAVEPAVEAVAAEGTFVEPTIMMLVMSLDRFAYFAQGKKSRALAAQLEYCLGAVRINWPEVGSNLGLARFLANVNNALKHPDRAGKPEKGGYPSGVGLVAAKGLAQVLVRGQLLPLLDAPEETFGAFLQGPAVRRAKELFTSQGLTVGDDGLLRG